MTQLNLSLRVPDDLARQVRARGILASSSLTAMLRRELRRRELNRLAAPIRRLRSMPIIELTEEQLGCEVKAVRRQRSAHANRS